MRWDSYFSGNSGKRKFSLSTDHFCFELPQLANMIITTSSICTLSHVERVDKRGSRKYESMECVIFPKVSGPPGQSQSSANAQHEYHARLYIQEGKLLREPTTWGTFNSDASNRC